MYKSLVGTAGSWINKAVLRSVCKVKMFPNYCRLAILVIEHLRTVVINLRLRHQANEHT